MDNILFLPKYQLLSNSFSKLLSHGLSHLLWITSLSCITKIHPTNLSFSFFCRVAARTAFSICRSLCLTPLLAKSTREASIASSSSSGSIWSMKVERLCMWGRMSAGRPPSFRTYTWDFLRWFAFFMSFASFFNTSSASLLLPTWVVLNLTTHTWPEELQAAQTRPWAPAL